MSEMEEVFTNVSIHILVDFGKGLYRYKYSMNSITIILYFPYMNVHTYVYITLLRLSIASVETVIYLL